jgi:menaquinone-specific isochorismate synthase
MSVAAGVDAATGAEPFDPTRWRARTERLDVDVDLLALAGHGGTLFEHGRRGLAGLDPLPTRLAVPRTSPEDAAAAVADALGAIDCEDRVALPGSGPVALGALPFDPSAPASLVISRATVGRAEDGTRWITTLVDRDAPSAAHDTLRDLVLTAVLDGHPSTGFGVVAGAVGPVGGAPLSDIRITSSRPPLEWCAALEAARDELRAGAADKVVLAREVVVRADAPLPRAAILDRLERAYPSCMIYAVDGFVGATPELLVSRLGDIVRSHPMAGTTPRSADPTTDARLAAALLASTKDREEHRITIDMVHDTLLRYCSYIDEEAEPSVVAMANVSHLATLVEGRLSSPPATAIELMTALHPTPAVCGSPRADALALIDRYEDLDRGPYAGPVGWVDAAGNGEWAVGLRCAVLDGSTARLFAGVGVVADSDPDAELAETQAKLQAVLAAIIRP